MYRFDINKEELFWSCTKKYRIELIEIEKRMGYNKFTVYRFTGFV